MTILDNIKSLYVMDEGRLFNLGWILGVIAGLQIFIVGIIFYFSFAVPMIQQTAPDPFWKNFFVITFVGLANLIGTGLTAIVLCLFGLRRKMKWAWLLLVFFVLFIGLNDSLVMIKVGYFPFPLAPTILGSIALILTFQPILRKSNE